MNIDSKQIEFDALVSHVDEKISTIFNQNDSQIISVNPLLTAVQSMACHGIFADFEHSFEVETQLWEKIFRKLLTEYRSRVEKFKMNYKEHPVEFRKNYERFELICKTIGKFYRDFIKRVVLQLGASDIVKTLAVKVLKLDIESESIKSPVQSIASRVDESIAYALCRLGDLSRYRTGHYYLKAQDGYKHARLYYHTALTIDSSQIIAINQLGQTFASDKNYLSALYWCVKACCVESPYVRDNVDVVVKKILRDQALSEHVVGEMPEAAKHLIATILQKYAYYYYIQVLKNKQAREQFLEANRWLSQFQQLVFEHQIPLSVLLQFSVLGPMIVDLSERTNAEVFRSGQENLGLRLTICLLERLLRAAISIMQDTDDIDQLSILLPSLRVYFDWCAKYVGQYRSRIPGDNTIRFKDVLSLSYEFVKLITDKHGFLFDPLTSVSMGVVKCTLEEEKQVLDITVFDKGLSDIPSGMNIIPEDNANKFRVQCILFSAIELTRLECTYLKFDDRDHSFIFDEDEDPEAEVVLLPRSKR